MNLQAHLAEIEKLADAFANPDGTEIILARARGMPAEAALAALELMRRSFCVGALAGLAVTLPEGSNPDVPDEWLKRNGVPWPAK